MRPEGQPACSSTYDLAGPLETAGLVISPGTGLLASVAGFFNLAASQPSAVSAINPAMWPSHETAAEVGRTPLSIPPYPRMQTADNSSAPNVRLNQANDAKYAKKQKINPLAPICEAFRASNQVNPPPAIIPPTVTSANSDRLRAQRIPPRISSGTVLAARC